MGQEQVQHRGLIHHEGLRFQRVLFVEAELHGLRVKGEHAVDGFRLLPGHLREPLRSPSGWRGQKNGLAHRTPQVHHCFGREGLAASRPSGQHQQARGSRQFDRPALLLRKGNTALLGIPIRSSAVHA